MITKLAMKLQMPLSNELHTCEICTAEQLFTNYTHMTFTPLFHTLYI